MAPGQAGYCGLRENRQGKLVSRYSSGCALATMYLDPLPTNCCAAWFCRGSKEKGSNLAVFFYGCNFDCLFCQNASHKLLDRAPQISAEEMVAAALDPRVRCVCFFGGSPEPQLSFAVEVSERIAEESGNSKRICWEWNGCGREDLVRKAAELSAQTGGTVKFDLKAFTPAVRTALCGVESDRAFQNFSMLADYAAKMSSPSELLTATTLLVPYYVDRWEVGEIARFIASLDPGIPYSLLAFHPDFFLKDLPRTPREQATACLKEAEKHLLRVNIGNRHLLGML